jgi:hypothetical protein
MNSLSKSLRIPPTLENQELLELALVLSFKYPVRA